MIPLFQKKKVVTPKFEVQKNNSLASPNRRIIDYSLVFEDPERPRGSGQLSLRPFGHYQNKEIVRLTPLAQMGFKSDDTVAEIIHFYPHGPTTNLKNPAIRDELVSKGVGSKLLDEMVADAQAEHAKFVVVYSGVPSLQNFLPRRKFECPLPGSKQFYRIV